MSIHTDGGCEGNPGPGGWAAVLRYGRFTHELAGGEPATTNNRMEIMAAIAALAALNQPCLIEIHTDSQYLRKGISEWIKGWKRNGWRTSSREPVKNADLWKQLDTLASQHTITWRWLKGHAGHPDNERCDALAAHEIAKIRQSHTPAALDSLREKFLAERDGG